MNLLDESKDIKFFFAPVLMPTLNSIDGIEKAIKEVEEVETPDAALIDRIEASINSKASFIPVYTLNKMRRRITDLKSKLSSMKAVKLDFPLHETNFPKPDIKFTIPEPSRESVESVNFGENVNLFGHADKKFSYPGHFKTVSLRGLKNCTVEVGPCKGPVFVIECQDCHLRISGHQIRISNSTNLHLYAFAAASISLEESFDIRIENEVEWYSEYHIDKETVGFGSKKNNYLNIQDFTKL